MEARVATPYNAELRWAESQRRWMRRLQRIFKLTSVTQTEVAERAGVNIATVSLMKRGAHVVTRPVVEAACELYYEWREDLRDLTGTMDPEDFVSLPKESGGA